MAFAGAPASSSAVTDAAAEQKAKDATLALQTAEETLAILKHEHEQLLKAHQDAVIAAEQAEKRARAQSHIAEGKAREARQHEVRADAHEQQVHKERKMRQDVEHVLRQHQASPTGAPKPAATDSAADEPLAIIGMSGAFACSPSVADYWRVCRDGEDCITVGPQGRWDVEWLFDEDQDAAGKSYSKWGGFLDNVDMFDAPFFQISAREARGMDPQQRFLLEKSWEALEDGAVLPETLQDTQMGVFIGIQQIDYSRLTAPLGYLDELDAYWCAAHPSTASRPCCMLRIVYRPAAVQCVHDLRDVVGQAP